MTVVAAKNLLICTNFRCIFKFLAQFSQISHFMIPDLFFRDYRRRCHVIWDSHIDKTTSLTSCKMSVQKVWWWSNYKNKNKKREKAIWEAKKNQTIIINIKDWNHFWLIITNLWIIIKLDKYCKETHKKAHP